MIIISHNRVINWSNVLVARAYDGPLNSRVGHTELVFQTGHVTNLTIKYDDFVEQITNAGIANVSLLELNY